MFTFNGPLIIEFFVIHVILIQVMLLTLSITKKFKYYIHIQYTYYKYIRDLYIIHTNTLLKQRQSNITYLKSHTLL